MQPGWLRTYTGKFVSLRCPDKTMVCLEDVAHHLSNEARWAGATTRHYSVGEHSIWVMRRLRQLVTENQDYFGLLGLMHDGHEFVLKDVPTPLKVLLPSWYREACTEWDHAIADSLGFKFPNAGEQALVHQADAEVAWVESQSLFKFKRPPSGQEPDAHFRVWMSTEVRKPRTPESIEHEFKGLAEHLIQQAAPR